MIPLDLDEVAALCPGRLARAAGATAVTGVVIDSRRVTAGDLFVAAGDRGDSYVDDALGRGAAAALCPDDAFAALAELGRAVRSRATATVVAITGSTGKTSTKDILAAICTPGRTTVAAEASYNNELGVPLTLCRLEADTEICIVELAMRGKGQIAALAELARPSVAVITNVGPAHLERVGSLEAVAEAKGELLASLPSGAVAIVPADFRITRDDIEVVRRGQPDARAENGTTRLRFDGREIEFGIRGRHHAENALSALLAARALGVDVSSPVDVTFSRWRGEEVVLPRGGVLVNDCWNANPMSMRAALESLVERSDCGRTVAVLGEMAELGPDSDSYHLEIGQAVAALGVGVLVAVGARGALYVEGAEGVPEVAIAADADEAAGIVRELIRPGDCVLVKGSRVVGLEVVADALAGVRD